MSREQELWVPWSTAEELLAAAARQRTPASKRLIVEWTGLGLLDQPHSPGLGQGRGRQRGVWPWEQRQLFLLLLRKRSEVSRLRALFNIPVFLWLGWGERHVPIRQVRRVMSSWVRGGARVSDRTAWRVARQTVAEIAHPSSGPHHRKRLTEVIATGMKKGDVHRTTLRRALDPVLDPKKSGQPWGPAGAGLTTEGLTGLVESRIVASVYLDDFDDADFERARGFYLKTRADYRNRWKQFAQDPDLGRTFAQPTFTELLNNACIDLLSNLGMLKGVSTIQPT